MAGQRAITIVTNEDFQLSCRWMSDTTPVLVSSAHMQVRAAAGAATISLLVDPYITLRTDGSGWIDISIPAAVAESLDPGTYAYDLIVVRASDSHVRQLLAGQCTVQLGVTR